MGRFRGLIIGIVIASLGAILVMRMLGGQGAQTEAPKPVDVGTQQLKTVNIYVAALPIAVGSVISPEMLTVQPWPEHLVLDGFIRADAAAASPIALGSSEKQEPGVVGTVARAPFQQQEPIIKSKLANPNDPNFLAGALPKGMRIVTMAANEIEGVAGFVFPGDHVDILFTHTVEKTSQRLDASTQEAKEEKTTENYTETLLNNVVVVAVDQHSSNVGTTDKEGKLLVPRTVSLMVNPADAQKIRLGQKVGTLTLSLRSLADKDSIDPIIVAGQKDISQAESKPSGAMVDGGVLVYRGVQSSTAKNTQTTQSDSNNKDGAPAYNASSSTTVGQ